MFASLKVVESDEWKWKCHLINRTEWKFNAIDSFFTISFAFISQFVLYLFFFMFSSKQIINAHISIDVYPKV